jgi:predicted nucleic acid-binding protein
MPRPTVYLETSVIGYATSRPSRDLVVAARQQITRDWFALRAPRYELFISQLVATEVAGGDEDAARERAAFLQGIARLRVTDAAGELAARLVASGAVPTTMRQAIEGACREAGYEPPIICTPEELIDDQQR